MDTQKASPQNAIDGVASYYCDQRTFFHRQCLKFEVIMNNYLKEKLFFLGSLWTYIGMAFHQNEFLNVVSATSSAKTVYCIDHTCEVSRLMKMFEMKSFVYLKSYFINSPVCIRICMLKATLWLKLRESMSRISFFFICIKKKLKIRTISHSVDTCTPFCFDEFSYGYLNSLYRWKFCHTLDILQQILLCHDEQTRDTWNCAVAKILFRLWILNLDKKL